MSNHLSQKQFVKCAAGQAAKAELEHIAGCPGCSAELDRFRSTLSVFRSAVRNRIDDRLALHKPEITLSRTPAATGVSRWRWAMITAAVVALVVPYFVNGYRPKQEVIQPVIAETNPEAVMDRVNLHLSRRVPAPMEPIMSLIPSEELANTSGGVQ